MTVVLNTRSHFSIGESLLRPKQIVEEAVKAGVSAIALSDTMTVCAMPELFNSAKEQGVKAIIGVRLRIVDELFTERKLRRKFRPYYLRAIALTKGGFDAISALLSRSHQEDHFYEVPRLLLSDVVEILGSAPAGSVLVTLGDTYSAISAGKGRLVATALLEKGCRVGVDLTVSTQPYFIRHAYESLLIAQELDLEVLLGRPSLYDSPGKSPSLDLMRCIAANMTMSDLSARDQAKDWVVKSPKMLTPEIREMFDVLRARYGAATPHLDLNRALEKAIFGLGKITADATYSWDKQLPTLPKMADDHFSDLVRRCVDGWDKRLKTVVFGYQPEDLEPYRRRLQYELGVLRDKAFEPYFLLVAEIVNWSKSNGIRVGPGRGSVGGSLVAFLIGITDVDPIRFGLLFERFINPARPDLPDADLDFMSSRREEVIEWIISRFGEEFVAGVSNYTKVAGAGALSDVSKKLGLPNVPAFGSWFEKEHGVSKTLDESVASSPKLAEFAEDHPEAMEHARALEGAMRSYGRHAAGLVVGGVPLAERAVIERRGGTRVVCWDKRSCEDFGLVKLDILGLANLDMIDITINHIFRTRGRKIDVSKIPLNDPKILAEFGLGATVGVFQFASTMMRGILTSMASVTPLTFDDLSAATALGRPGPMESGLLDQFIKIKKGEASPSYLHPSMEEALRETYGVFVYQEQVMRVSRDFAGFSAVEAETLRKAMGKKDKDLMAKMEAKFVSGAVATHGVTDTFAAEVFRVIEGFAGYGFNKSHSVAYTLISYVCMFLKVYFPAEYYSGVLTMEKVDRRTAILSDMKRLGISLAVPDINASSRYFEPLHDRAVIAPLAAIKGISENTQEAILAARGDKPFTSIENLVERVERRRCNKAHVEKLNAVGAFAAIEPGQEPADHHSRRRAQVGLLEGLIADAVIVDRNCDCSVEAVTAIRDIQEQYRSHIFPGHDTPISCPRVWWRGPARFVIVLDSPSRDEEGMDEMGYGSAAQAIIDAMAAHGEPMASVYMTSLHKSVKPKEGFSTAYKANSPQFLDRELAALKPPLIVAMGNDVMRHLLPDLKGSMTELEGTVNYDVANDRNILVGMNPNRVIFDASKQENINAIIGKALSLLTI